MSLQSFHHRVIAGRGAWGAPLRGVLRGIELAYAAGVSLRNRRYDRGEGVERAPVPVISIGNITVGGTGKTPMVIDVVCRLSAMGCKPAVVSRGYRAGKDGANDEQRLIERTCPGTDCVAGADRVAAARAAAGRFGANVVVLDDGFQHRRLARDLDIVLLDATCAFGHGHMLPRGLLREPVSALRRAQLIVITREDLASTVELERIEARLRAVAPDVPRVRCRHRVTGLSDLAGAAVDERLDGRPVVLLAAIGNPGAFRATVQTMGAEVVGERWFADHHRYTAGDVSEALSMATGRRADLVLTTAKDAVKLAELRVAGGSGIRVVNICIDFAAGGDKMLMEALAAAVAGGAGA